MVIVESLINSMSKANSAKIDVLLKEIERLSKELSVVTEKYNTLERQINDKSRDQNVSVDFDVLKVFSIERSRMDDNAPLTIIGYVEKIAENVFIKEWYLHINENRHEQLVNEFNVWKKIKSDKEQLKLLKR